MTTHLSPDEFVDALDDALPAARAAHLDACDRCQGEVAELRAALGDASAVPVVEPSPLFWDHFSARVAHAVEAEAKPARRWWQPVWRPVAGVAAVAAMVLAVAPQPGPDTGTSPSSVTMVSDAGSLAPEDDGSWEFVVGLSADLAFDDVREAATPAAGTADEAIAELTAEQRAALVRLLRQEIGEP